MHKHLVQTLLFPHRREDLRAGFLNANSLKAHIQEICQFLKDDPSYHHFGIAESKLDPVVEDYLVQIDGYALVRQDRKLGDDRVALYVRNTLKVKILEKSNTTIRCCGI